MNDSIEKKTCIRSANGLHARPAAGIAKRAASACSDIWMIRDGEKVDASSVIDLLTLACEHGTEVTLLAESSADAAILHDILDYIESGFGE